MATSWFCDDLQEVSSPMLATPFLPPPPHWLFYRAQNRARMHLEDMHQSYGQLDENIFMWQLFSKECNLHFSRE